MPLYEETTDLLASREVTYAFLTAEEVEILHQHYQVSPKPEVTQLLDTLSTLGDLALQIMDGKPAAEIEAQSGGTIGDREEMRRHLLVAYPLVELVRQKMDPLPSDAALGSVRRRAMRYKRELEKVVGSGQVDRIEEELRQADSMDPADSAEDSDT